MAQLTSGADHKAARWAKPWDLVLQPTASLIGVDRLSKEIHQLWDNASDLEEKAKNVISVQKKALQAYQLRQQAATEKATASEASPLAGSPFADHFQLMFTLHRTLVQEYYDLFRATAYAGTKDDAPEALKRFCRTRQVPNRLWRYGIQDLLDFWRQRLPASKEYMHAYIIACYQMLTLLLETVEEFERSWLECLGGRSLYVETRTTY